MDKATPKYDISFPIVKEEYDFYLTHSLSHHEYYTKGQEAHKKEAQEKEAHRPII